MVRTSPWVAALALALGCSGGTAPSPPSAVPKSTDAPAPAAPANPDAPTLTAKDLQETAETRTLVPSPIETQDALEAAGIDQELSKSVVKRKFDLSKSDPDYIALRTGVVLADTLLTVVGSDKETLSWRLDQLRTGMGSLKAGEDIDAQLGNMLDRVAADSVTRGELLKQFDDLSGAVIPELEFEGNTRMVPLIQAGSWLEGANLVAKAIQSSGKPDAANQLLKQPAVVDYFLKYVRTTGSDKAPPQVTTKLVESLTTLQGVAAKTEPLTSDDVATVAKVTDEVLALL
jgi:hypothetical protein